MVLHGVGGHERNLPTNELAKNTPPRSPRGQVPGRAAARRKDEQAEQIATGPYTASQPSDSEPGNSVPLQRAIQHRRPGTGDIDEAVSAARSRGRAHARGRAQFHRRRELRATEARLEEGLLDIRACPEEEFEVGVAHSSELQFEHGSDISDGGITALVFKKNNQKSIHALIASDSNNAVIGLRKAVSRRAREGRRRPDRAVYL